MEKEVIIYDSFNGCVKADQTAINTLTTNCGALGMRVGVKIIVYDRTKTSCTNRRNARTSRQSIRSRRAVSYIDNNGGGNLQPKIMEIKQATKRGSIEVCEYGAFDMSYPESKTRRGRVQENGNVSPMLTAQNQEIGVVEPLDKYELSEKMKKYITSGNEKYDVSEENLVLNRSCACTVNTREGCTRADSSDYIAKELQEDYKAKKNEDLTNLRIRKLTPRECWRLMGFSDKDFDRAKSVNSDSQLYKQAGNSIVVPVLEEIFRRML